MNDISLRREVLQKHKEINLEKLTYVNGHSDYTVTQMITNGNKLTGVIDFSEVSCIPAIWEIMRFYFNSAPEIKLKRLDKILFSDFMCEYTERIALNEYDIRMLFYFNLFYFCQALSVYDKLFLNNFSKSYMDRIVSRNIIIQCCKFYCDGS